MLTKLNYGENILKVIQIIVCTKASQNLVAALIETLSSYYYYYTQGFGFWTGLDVIRFKDTNDLSILSLGNRYLKYIMPLVMSNNLVPIAMRIGLMTKYENHGRHRKSNIELIDT